MSRRCFRTLLVLLTAALSGVACSSSSSPPEAPSGLTAAAGDGEIVLSWDETEDGSVTEYRFRERASFDDDWWCWSTLLSGSGTVSRHALKGLPNGATYQIQLRAVNSAGESAASEASVTLPASSSSSVLEAPSGLAAEGGDQSIALSWDDPGDDSITEYQFREWFSEAFGWHCWRRIYGSNDSTTSHTMPDLTNGVSYEVQLRAMSLAAPGRPAQTSATPAAPG